MKPPVTQIILGIGGNLVPDGYKTLQEGCDAAIEQLAHYKIRVLGQSRWYETAPVPISDQPWFINAVILAETTLPAPTTLSVLHRIESRFGRTRNLRNEARVLDIDLVDFGGMVIKKENLILPHPRMHERAFVLLPLRDLFADWTHPQTGQSLDALIDSLPADQLIRPAQDW